MSQDFANKEIKKRFKNPDAAFSIIDNYDEDAWEWVINKIKPGKQFTYTAFRKFPGFKHLTEKTSDSYGWLLLSYWNWQQDFSRPIIMRIDSSNYLLV